MSSHRVRDGCYTALVRVALPFLAAFCRSLVEGSISALARPIPPPSPLLRSGVLLCAWLLVLYVCLYVFVLLLLLGVRVVGLRK